MNLNFVAYESIRIVLSASLGYVIGHLGDSSPEKCAIILAVGALAKTIFNCLLVTAEDEHEELTKSITYINIASDMISTVIMQRQKLITSEAAFGLAFLSALVNAS